MIDRLVKIADNNKIYYPVLILVISLSTFLNYDAKNMSGILPYYKDFARFISSGFDLSLKFELGAYTFPMWGYGFIYALTESKLIIVIIQQLFSLFVIYSLDKSFINLDYEKRQRNIFRLFSIFFLQIHLFNTVLWPYSLGSNLLILSGLYLIYYFKKTNIKYLIFSAFLYGLMLNFRSDYVYFTYIVIFSLLILSLSKKYIFKWSHIAFWFGLIQILIIPWGVYSYKRTGNYLQCSTNGGYVMVSSLGLVPGNKWSFTNSDDDPVIRNMIDSALGKDYERWGYKEDAFLKKKWKELIIESPVEYLKKCAYSIYLIARQPFYVGQIVSAFLDPEETNRFYLELAKNVKNNSYIQILNSIFSIAGFILVIIIFINLISIFILSRFFIILINGLIKLKSKVFYKPEILIFLLVFLYQMTFMIFIKPGPNYNTNIFWIYIVLPFFIQKTTKEAIR